MGASGSKHRKGTRHLPKVTGSFHTGPEPSPYTPMGVVAAYGKIARAAAGSDRRQRRAGKAIGVAFLLPLVIIAVVAIVRAI